MNYNTCCPYFPPQDIKSILSEFREILDGKGVLTMGRHVQKFEAEFAAYAGVKYAVATNSCTSGLEIALRSLGIGKGDEVIVPVQTFVATGSSVLTTGADVVFCNIDSNFLLDLEDLKKKITRRTKAVIIVHFAGLIHPEIVVIKEFLEQKKVALIEDAAHACGAAVNNRRAGTFGDIGCFSFFATKVMTTGEGGMIVVNDKNLFKLCSSMRNRGLDLEASYERYSMLGSNRRMSEVQGILGCHQLRRLDKFVSHRNMIAKVYRDELCDLADAEQIAFQEYPASIRHAYWRFVIFLKNTKINRNSLKKLLLDKGIRIDWPYQPLLHLQPLFRNMASIRKGLYARSERLAETHICLPIHLGINKSEAGYIAACLRKYIH